VEDIAGYNLHVVEAVEVVQHKELEVVHIRGKEAAAVVEGDSEEEEERWDTEHVEEGGSLCVVGHKTVEVANLGADTQEQVEGGIDYHMVAAEAVNARAEADNVLPASCSLEVH
jgi:hypothetical protein